MVQQLLFRMVFGGAHLSIKAGVHDGMLRLILILKEWSTYFPYDFRDVKTIETLKYVKEKSLLIDSSVQNEFQDIARHLAAQVQLGRTALEP